VSFYKFEKFSRLVHDFSNLGDLDQVIDQKVTAVSHATNVKKKGKENLEFFETSYSCGKIGLRGFPAAFLPMAEVVDEA